MFFHTAGRLPKRPGCLNRLEDVLREVGRTILEFTLHAMLHHAERDDYVDVTLRVTLPTVQVLCAIDVISKSNRVPRSNKSAGMR